jgi:hypothetical protein
MQFPENANCMTMSLRAVRYFQISLKNQKTTAASFMLNGERGFLDYTCLGKLNIWMR